MKLNKKEDTQLEDENNILNYYEILSKEEGDEIETEKRR